jgi:hypothetical protein
MPEELLINLLRTNEVLQLLKPGIGSKLKDLTWHIDSLKDLEKLLGAKTHIMLAAETGKLGMDLLE